MPHLGCWQWPLVCDRVLRCPVWGSLVFSLPQPCSQELSLASGLDRGRAPALAEARHQLGMDAPVLGAKLNCRRNVAQLPTVPTYQHGG